MTVHEELAKASPPGDTALTIGTFDGVHLGHQHLLQRLRAAAADRGLLALALTFRNHPRNVLNPEAKLQHVTTLEDRLALIRDQGVDQVVALDFTKELSLIKAPDFVALLRDSLRMKGLVVGPDFALGHRREGDVPTLRSLGAEMGFWVEAVEPLQLGSSVIRSSEMRGLIVQGNVEEAAHLMGRLYSLTGTVVEGDRRGRLLGFPTANLDLDPGLVVPADGIYATWAIVESRRYQAATGIGVRPTFGSGQRTVEAFILDFEGDIYGKALTLEFASRLRDEQAFSTAEALIEQMKVDVEQSRDVLSSLAASATKADPGRGTVSGAG